MKVGCFDFKV